jgi:hypothetical protein
MCDSALVRYQSTSFDRAQNICSMATSYGFPNLLGPAVIGCFPVHRLLPPACFVFVLLPPSSSGLLPAAIHATESRPIAPFKRNQFANGSAASRSSSSLRIFPNESMFASSALVRSPNASSCFPISSLPSANFATTSTGRWSIALRHHSP